MRVTIGCHLNVTRYASDGIQALIIVLNKSFFGKIDVSQKIRNFSLLEKKIKLLTKSTGENVIFI